MSSIEYRVLPVFITRAGSRTADAAPPAWSASRARPRAPSVKQELAAIRVLFDWLTAEFRLSRSGGGRSRVASSPGDHARANSAVRLISFC